MANTDQGLLDEAERHLRALAGDDARQRPRSVAGDQRPGRGRAPALVVQRTRRGKSAVYFVATALLRGAPGGP